MPSAAAFRPRWQATLGHCSTLTDLQRAVRYNGPEGPAVKGSRSLCWKVFLLFNNVSATSWTHGLDEMRTTYAETSQRLLKFIKHPEELTTLTADPLTDDPDSPWNSLRQDEVIRSEIAQDVRRLPDEPPFYQQERIQDMIIDILFVYCKLNPSIGGYRQGMHELLAPIVYVVANDAVDKDVGDLELDDSDRLMVQMLDSSYVEHDAFSLFCKIMDRAGTFYEVRDPTGAALTPGSESGGSSVIVEKSRFIHEVCLQKVDPQLARHLKTIEILPQIFLIRWIRLLYSREFPFDELLVLWDTLFAVDRRLDLVDLICVAMLLRIRWELLEADYSVCLQLLLKYPGPAAPHGPSTFVDDALYLRDHLNPSGATSLLMKYTGRVPSVTSSPARSPRASTPNFPNIGSFRSRALGSRSPLPAASRFIQQQGGVEALFQGAAKNVIERSEKLGINQAVRDAMGEIRRNMQTLQEARSSSIGTVKESLDTEGTLRAADALLAFEGRNKQLAGLLEETLAGLQAVTEGGLEDKAKSLEMIEMAASKVQFVKAYLEDPSADVPEFSTLPSQNDGATGSQDADNDVAMDSASDTLLKTATTSPAVVPDPMPAISTLSLADQAAEPSPSPQPLAGGANPASDLLPPARPKPLPTRSSIAQSSFAWMLEPDTSKPAPLLTTDPSASLSAASAGAPSSSSPTFKAHKKRRSGNASRQKNAFLFGEVIAVEQSGEATGGGKGAVTTNEIFGLEPLKKGGNSPLF